MDRARYRAIKSNIKLATTMQKQLRLSGTVNNHLRLAIAIKQHLNQGRRRAMEPNITPEPTTVL